MCRTEPSTVDENSPLIDAGRLKKASDTNDGKDGVPPQAMPSTIDTMRYCLRFVVPDSTLAYLECAAVMVCILGAKVFHLVMGLFLKLSVDSLTMDSGPGRGHAPYVNALYFLVGRLLVALFTQGFEVAQEHYSQRVQRKFSVHAFSRLLHRPLQPGSTGRTGGVNTGDAVAVVRRGVESLDVLLRQLVFWLLPTLTETVYVSVIFCSLGSPAVAGITIATVAVHTVYTARLTARRARLARRVRDAQNAVWDHATERLARAAHVCAHGMPVREASVHDALRATLQTDAYRSKTLVTWFSVSADFILQAGTAGCLLVAGLAAANGRLSVGDFSLVATYVSALFWPLLVLAQSYGDVVSAIADVEQLVGLIARTDDVTDERLVQCDADERESICGKQDHTTDCQPKKGVEFRNVSFRYPTVQSHATACIEDHGVQQGRNAREENHPDESQGAFEGIQNLSFRASPGAPVAFVGPSGSGKSTILSLILGLQCPQQGEIVLNGNNVSSVYVPSGSSRAGGARPASAVSPLVVRLRTNRGIGAVLQDPTVFSGSVRDNVSYGREVSDAVVWDALAKAGVKDKVVRMGGLDASIGELGSTLSGGERQRIGIARAFVHDFHIVLTDEATAALSPLDEQCVTKELRKRAAHTALVLVAHRLKTVMFAREIIVLDRGAPCERGTHDQLVARGGLYAKMWHAQMSTDYDDGDSH